MQIFYGGLLNETNAFSPIPCREEDFLEFDLLLDQGSWGAMFAPLIERGWPPVSGFNRIAQPAGLIPSADYHRLRDQLMAQIEQQPWDAVLLNMHGAMAAEGEDDCEGDILARIRDHAGPGVFVGAVLDPHCHLTAAMHDNADLLVFYKEYPHTDIIQAWQQMADICVRVLDDKSLKIVSSLFDCKQIDIYHTSEPPMCDLVRRLHAIETEPDILSASIVHGFPWGDAADLGSRVLVYARGNLELADAKAAEIGERLMQLRGQCRPEALGADEALDIAARNEGLTVLADMADNAGGGAPSDSTFLLQALLDRPDLPAAIGLLWDPAVVEEAFSAGIGAIIQTRIGGRHGACSGEPVEVEAEVVGLTRGYCEKAPGYGGIELNFGDLAGLRVGQTFLLLSNVRTQLFIPDVFVAAGIDIGSLRTVVVKSTQHFRAGFDAIASRTFYVDTPGTLTMDFANIPYRKASPDLWPRKD